MTSATYDAANRQRAFGGRTLTYDPNGNLINDGTQSYVWDARNRLVALEGLTAASFEYDALGRRTTKTIGGMTTAFVYDGLNTVEELTLSAATQVLVGLGLDEHLTRTDSVRGRYSVLTDALGSVLALSNDGGVIDTEYTYEPFGATTATGVANSSAAQYTGRENDSTALYYYRARYCHPNLQRFISEDPIGFAGGDSNLYAYVMNQPSSFIDPLGLEPVTISAAAAVAITCAVGAVAGDVVVLAVNGRKTTWGQLAAGAGIGCVGGIGVLAAYAIAVPAAFSEAGTAIAAAPWIIIPPALAKLDQLAAKYGTTTDAIVRAAQQSNARFTDLLAKNLGNINIFLARPDGAGGFVRVTTDPSGARVISAGLMRSGQVANGIINGRFVPLR